MEFTHYFTRLGAAFAGREKRIIVQQGGTSSSKTYSTLQLLTLIALKGNYLISVVSETLPHLKRGAMRDFFGILLNAGIYREKYHNKTDNTYRLNESTIEFFGADSADKMRGARRDILYINECNNVPYPVFDQLEIRTKARVLLDFNPVNEFWVHEKVLPRDDVEFLKSNYTENQFLDAAIVKSIERRRETDPNWWKVYGLGEVGKLEGVIFRNWQMVDAMPEVGKWEVYGMDFGYTNDPTTLVRVMLQGGELWIDELVYETGMTNQDICKKLEQLGLSRSDLIIADSAEPKSIEEIHRGGFNIKGALKGADSIRNGIDNVNKYKLNVTKRSVNLIKELRNYKWAEDKTGKLLNKPVDNFNHAIDAMRYSVNYKVNKRGANILAFG